MAFGFCFSPVCTGITREVTEAIEITPSGITYICLRKQLRFDYVLFSVRESRGREPGIIKGEGVRKAREEREGFEVGLTRWRELERN